ncbi:ATP-binding protein [Clostridium disporicum]|uniref:ATP-binding protein n=1 Tax=Clostridium disporicum TaxID=84024 RepID=UPI0034A2644A
MLKGYIVGKTNTKILNIANQIKPYIQSEFLIIKDKLQGDIPCEVIETTILPFVEESVLEEGITTRFIEKLGINIEDPIFMAKVKVLKDLAYPIMPNSKVFQAKYDEISNIISKAKPEDSMVVGIIKGTELSQNELPIEIQKVAPLWEKGSAVEQQGVPLMINHHSFREYPHIGLFGSSGSGKSFAMRVLNEELMKLGVPVLAFDPHQEMRFEGAMNGLSDELKKDFKSKYDEFIIGVNVGIKFTDLNFGELATLFDFIDGLTEPQRNALEVLYDKGDTLNHLKQKITTLKTAFDKVEINKNSRGKKGDSLSELTPLETELYEQCKNKVSGAITLQALSWKCVSLENTGIFVSDTSAVKNAMLQGKSAIIRGDITRLQMISSYLISKLYKARRNYIDDSGDYFPPFFTVVDEAHNFAPSEGKFTPTRSVLRKIGQEARKYGVFLMLCTQRPKNLDATLLAQLNTKFIFRLTDKTDIEVAKIEGNLTNSQVETLPDLASGNCFVSSAILNKTYPVRFRTTFSKAPNVSDPFDELKSKINTSLNSIEEVVIKLLPIDTIRLGKKLPEIKSELGCEVSPKDVINALERLVEKGLITKQKAPGVGVKYK